MAKKLRGSMTLGQLHDFASGPMTGKPGHVSKGHPARNLGSYHHAPKRRG
jgi:hypothetical protein